MRQHKYSKGIFMGRRKDCHRDMSHRFNSDFTILHVIGLEERERRRLYLSHAAHVEKVFQKVQSLHVIFGCDMQSSNSCLLLPFLKCLTVLCRHVNFHDVSDNQENIPRDLNLMDDFWQIHNRKTLAGVRQSKAIKKSIKKQRINSATELQPV